MGLGYMTGEDYADIATAGSFTELAEIALRILERMGDGVGMVCGPISTGGLGDVRKNLERFNQAIETLEGLGNGVFNQMPFEDAIQRLRDWNVPYDERILTEFYAVIFKSGRIEKQYFIHDWPTSYGSTWERRQAAERGSEIIDLDETHHPLPRAA